MNVALGSIVFFCELFTFAQHNLFTLITKYRLKVSTRIIASSLFVLVTIPTTLLHTTLHHITLLHTLLHITLHPLHIITLHALHIITLHALHITIPKLLLH